MLEMNVSYFRPTGIGKAEQEIELMAFGIRKLYPIRKKFGSLE